MTSDLAGFGDYTNQNVPDPHMKGIHVIKRKGRSYDDAAGQLANKLHNFIRLSRRERIDLRNKVESSAQLYDWDILTKYYEQAYGLCT